MFNRKNSDIYNDAVVVDDYLKEGIETLRKLGKFSNKELEYPDLGDLPEGEGDEEEEEDEDDEDEEEDEEEEEEDEDDEEDEDTPRKASGKRGRPPMYAKQVKKIKVAETVEEEKRKKRGRPPTVDKPHEHRIKAILRGVRKTKEPDTKRHLYPAFEKLPDPKLFPQYYAAIKQPMSLDVIRKNIKRRKYPHVEAFLADMNVMFHNVKRLNKEDTQMYKDSIRLQKAMVRIAQEELAKPDSVYQDPDSSSKTSRLPLDSVQHNGEIYRVGDWIHILNGNEGCPPTVGQIFRIWQTADGQQWINACWYYRPEQTVHRYNKLFYENEVVKSGQYRDHLVGEILEKCFVMFFTRYQRGRPKGFHGDVYCCESRYNEHEKTFNKIRTWKACIPDEVRSTDYPMDLFEKHQPLRRVVSPLKDLLPPDAKEDDPKPDPKLGVPNAPPVQGAVYKRPYDANEPPEEPTPEDWEDKRQVLMKKMVQTAATAMLPDSNEPEPNGGFKFYNNTPQTTPMLPSTMPAPTMETPSRMPHVPSPFMNIEPSPQQNQALRTGTPGAVQTSHPGLHSAVPVVPLHQTLPATAHAASSVMHLSPYAPVPPASSGGGSFLGSTAGYQQPQATAPCTFTLPEEVEKKLDPCIKQNQVLGRLEMKVKVAVAPVPVAPLAQPPNQGGSVGGLGGAGGDEDEFDPLPVAPAPVQTRTVIKDRVVWFNGPPLFVAHRRVQDPLTRQFKLEFSKSGPAEPGVNGEVDGALSGAVDSAEAEDEGVEDEKRGLVSLGHSAKYLVYRRARQQAEC